MKWFKKFRDFLLESATTKGTYAGVRFSEHTVDNLIQLQGKLDVPNPIPYNKFHTTLLYSRKYLPEYKAFGKYTEPMQSNSSVFHLEIWKSSESGRACLVLLYGCKDLSMRHDDLMRQHEATFDFPDYRPHVTLSYDVGEWHPEVREVTFEDGSHIEVVEEYQEELNLDWAESVLKEHVTQGINTVIW